jgi:hypothetical protein
MAGMAFPEFLCFGSDLATSQLVLRGSTMNFCSTCDELCSNPTRGKKLKKNKSHLRLVLAILPSKGEMPVACTEKAKKATSWVGLVLSLSCVSTAPGLNSHNIF